MCGIAGVVDRDAGAARSDMERSLAALSHRGPNGTEIQVVGECVLGQTRLAIIDLSDAGQEPMPNEDRSIWMTFNGEIYNFQELREELEMLGHVFRSKTDAEVVLHGYEQWGDHCVDHFRGMFAFAVWDAHRKRMFLARDRLGKKPLFYAEARGRFAFASELQGLVGALGSTPSPDLEAMWHYLSWGYIPAPLTGFEGVRKLPAGHRMSVEMAEGELRMRTERYWRLSYEPKSSLDPDEAAGELRELLGKAVALRLISDVPLGAFLSGGIDSSIVVGLMAQLSSGPVRTFSIGFSEHQYNELEHARRIARLWGTDHHELIVEPDAVQVLPLLVRHFGEPFADSSAIPTYYVAKMTSREVTVALNGDGGDESFSGYDRYLATALANRLARVPGVGSLSAVAAQILPQPGDHKSPLRKAHRFLAAVGFAPQERYASWTSYFSETEKERLWTADQGSVRRSSEWFRSLALETDASHPVDLAMAMDIHSYLPYDLLVKVDIAAMANSLECRSPFLDHHVMEFAARLPARLKLRGTTKKYLLKHAFPDLLPPENAARPKMGFGVPVGSWFRGPLRELLGDTLLSESVRLGAYLNAAVVKRMVKAHLEGRERSAQIWNLLMLEMWLREVVEGTGSTLSSR